MNNPDQHEKSSPKPALQGIRVIELGTFISAPAAAALLGDFGAEVIKIELPNAGDPMRTLGSYPPDGDSSYWWSSIARNKRSVALDVRTPEGREILGQLLPKTSILIENFRPGTLDRWGITADWLEEQSPGIIVVRISGYGQNGPWRDVPGFDRSAQAFSGLVYVTGEKDGPPQQAGLPVCDYTAGLWAAFGAVIAMLGKLRHNDPAGDEIDLALYETMIPFLKNMPAIYRHEGEITERTGNTPDYVAPGGAYKTGDDEWVFVSGTGDRMFIRLMTAIGRSDMSEAAEFKHNSDRVKNRDQIDAAINDWMAARSTQEVLDAFEKAEVAAVKIQNIADLVEHPQVLARGNFVDMEDPILGATPVSAPVPRLKRRPGSLRWTGEKLGAATRKILEEELGYDEASLKILQNRGVIGG